MRTLIWDFDGTLGYRKGGMFGAALLEVVQQAAPDLEITQDQIRPHLQSGFPWHTPERAHVEIAPSEQWWERLYPVFERALGGIGFDGSEARSMAREARAIYTDPERWCLFDDVIPTLEELTSCDCDGEPQGSAVILSNHVPELDDIVWHLGLQPHVAQVFNSAKTGYEKPHPRAFQIVVETLSDSDQFWMIGDSMRADVASARAVGIPGILVRQPHEDAGRRAA